MEAENSNQIDELKLSIDVDAKKQDVALLNSLASSIERLNRAVSNVSALDKYLTSVGHLSKEMAKVSANTATVNAMKPANLKTQKVETTKQEGSMPSIQGTEKVNDELEHTEQQAKETSKAIDNVAKSAEKGAKKMSGFKKFLNSLGRIALYRIIRAGLKMITSGLKEGLENIRTTDKALDLTLKRISQSGITIKNSFASALGELLKTLEPLITSVADGIATIANRVAEARAALSGATTYTKILTSDTKEWNEQLEKAEGYLTSFDKFESLMKGDNKYTGVIEAEVGMSAEEASSVLASVQAMKDLIVSIGTTLLVIKRLNFIGSIKDISAALGQGAGLLGILSGIYAIISSINSMAKWDEFTTSAEKLYTVLKLIFGVIALIAGIVAFMTGSGIAGAIAVIATIGVIKASMDAQTASMESEAKRKAAKKYAEGGIPQVGTLFYAGEAGAEAVYNTGSGQTGVVNIEQFTAAMYNALSAYGAAKGSDMRIQPEIVLNGAKVGQSIERSVYEEGVRVGHFAKA